MSIYTLMERNRTIPEIEMHFDFIRGTKIDLGCGKKKRPGYIGVDCFDHESVDCNIDINSERLPFGDNSVNAIRAIHCLEHISDAIHIWNEMWRVCRPGALIYVVVPHPQGGWYFQDPTHKTPYTEKTLRQYFDGDYVSSFSEYGFKGKMESVCTFVYGLTFEKLCVNSVLQVIK